MTAMGELVEVQGTAESGSFSRSALDEMLTLAESGISSLLRTQEAVLGGG